MAAVRRPPGRVALTVIFAALALNAWAQVLLVPLGRTSDPLPLVVLQALIGASGLAAAWGSWTAARWAPAAALGYGLVTGGMLVTLGPLLDLPVDARPGLWTGAGAIVAGAGAAAWYLRRSRRSAVATRTSPAA